VTKHFWASIQQIAQLKLVEGLAQNSAAEDSAAAAAVALLAPNETWGQGSNRDRIKTPRHASTHGQRRSTASGYPSRSKPADRGSAAAGGPRRRPARLLPPP